MEMLQTIEPLILTLHILICIFLVVVILLQAGKGADIGATFGAGGSQSLFGARGAATFLSKLTTVAAILFLVTSLSLTGIHRNRAMTGGSDSVLDKVPEPESATPAPAAPAEPTATPPQGEQKPVETPPQ